MNNAETTRMSTQRFLARFYFSPEKATILRKGRHKTLCRTALGNNQCIRSGQFVSLARLVCQDAEPDHSGTLRRVPSASLSCGADVLAAEVGLAASLLERFDVQAAGGGCLHSLGVLCSLAASHTILSDAALSQLRSQITTCSRASCEMQVAGWQF